MCKCKVIASMATLPLTNRLFARRAAYMASGAAKWAADSLDLELDAPVGQDVVRRFAEEMRGRIERMERDCVQNEKCRPQSTEAVITEKMWLAGLAEARRAGMGPTFTCCDYRRLKTWLSAAYRAMRLAECADEK